MHELSLAMDVCRITEDHVGADALARVTAVGLEVGQRSGVEVEAFRFALEALFETPPFRGAVPRIRRTAGEELRVAWIDLDDREEEADGDPPDRRP